MKPFFLPQFLKGAVRKVASPLFLVVVVAPTLCFTLYVTFIASEMFISEAKFVVRQPERKNVSALGMFLQSAGITTSRDETFTVREFILSRTAMRVVEDTHKIRDFFSDGSIDIFHRFNPLLFDDGNEALFRYYKRHVSVEVESGGSIVLLQVHAYTAEMAYNICMTLMALGESFVNSLNDRARKDMIRFAANELMEAENKSKTSALALSAYRDQVTVIDPQQQTSLHLQQIAKLQSELINVKSQLSQLKSVAGDSPHIKALESRREELAKSIREQSSLVTGGSQAMTAKLGEYQRLTLEKEFADKRLLAAMTSLDQVREEASRQQLYLESIDHPVKPDGYVYPKRLRMIALVFVSLLLVYGVVSFFLIGVREHCE